MRLIWTPTAIKDLQQIHTHLEREAGPTIAASQAARIVHAARILSTFPDADRYDPEANCRVLVAKGTPYLIYHRSVGDAVKLLRVRHSNRKPLRRVPR